MKTAVVHFCVHPSSIRHRDEKITVRRADQASRRRKIHPRSILFQLVGCGRRPWNLALRRRRPIMGQKLEKRNSASIGFGFPDWGLAPPFFAGGRFQLCRMFVAGARLRRLARGGRCPGSTPQAFVAGLIRVSLSRSRGIFGTRAGGPPPSATPLSPCCRRNKHPLNRSGVALP